MKATEKLVTVNANGKYICVGLDTNLEKIPSHLLTDKNPVLEFNRQIVEATKNSAAAYKINLAFYECNGTEGLKNLEETLALIPSDILTIADGKRGDIGNTSKMYANSIFERFNFDATTLNPLMGKDSLKPFIDYSDKLNFILALTSNSGSKDFQTEELKSGDKLYQLIIKKVLDWNEQLNCGLVFGATKLSELAENLNLIKNLPLLIPGIGAQGGDLNELSKILFSAYKKYFLINVSRGIIYKSGEVNFAEEAARELNALNTIIKENQK
jgi:orotidine-5'-phosphate decarboxylase